MSLKSVLKAAVLRKLLAATGSTTIGVAGLILAGAAWIAVNPETLTAITPKWGAGIVAAAGALVALARSRSL